MDLFEMDQRPHLLIVDYFSRFITVNELDDPTDAKAICNAVKKACCTIGIPNTIVTDDGPHFITDGLRNCSVLGTYSTLPVHLRESSAYS